MPLARINGIEIYYETHGDGPAMVLAHGAGGNHLSWWQQVPVLSRSFRCITFDHRSFGYSRDLPDGPGPKAFVDDLKALLDHLEIEKTILVAQSMGGWTSLGFANAYPERVRALILCDTTAGMDDADVIREQAKLNDVSRGGVAEILTRVCAPDFPQRAPARFFLYHQISGLNIHVSANMLPALLALRHGVDNVVQKRIPTMLMVGEKDALTTPKVMELMARRLNAPLIRVQGAGHSVYFETPEEFNRIVLDFLREK